MVVSEFWIGIGCAIEKILKDGLICHFGAYFYAIF